MLEQQKAASQSQDGGDTEKRTQLEGIRQKVFMDRYSLKDSSGQPLEFYPEQLWARVARGIAEVETTEEKKAFWEKRFYEALSNFQFVPGGRILAGAGSGHQVTYYNCFSADTLVHTKQGLVAIGTLQGEHKVLSQSGVYRTAFFKSYGKQQLWRVTLANGTIIYATADHQWVVNKEKGGTERVLTRDLAGRRIPINARPAPEYNRDFTQGVQHGITYGDGSMQYGKAHVCLFGEKEQLAQWFSTYAQKESGGTVATKEHVRIQGLPATWKELPGMDASASYWRGFVAGLIATDGHVDGRGSVAIYNRDNVVLAQIAEGMAIAGFVSSGITMTRQLSPYDGEEKPVYRLQIFKTTVNSHDILHPKHLENFLDSPKAQSSSIGVESVWETDRYEEVFCCVEPETHTITISHGYLTGQCYVIPSPEDSRQGILDNLKVMTEIMARGGGVGINLSTLRPRGSYIKTVNGTASGPCSWAQLYSVATGDVIQQGGCFGPNEYIATDKGLIRAEELAHRLDTDEVVQAQTHKGLRPFTAVFRNGVKDLYEVTTSRGYRVRVTLDHKMGILRNGEIVTIPLREFEEGDEILLLLGEGVKDNETFVPLSSSPYNRSKMSTTLNEKVTLPTHLTPELAYLLGYFYGDGCVKQWKKVTWQDEKGISFAVSNTQPDVQSRLISLIKELFSIEPRVNPGDGACTNVTAYSRLLVEWLQENGLLKQKSHAIRVPEAIFQSPSTVMGAFLGGYFDADGSDRGGKGGYGFDSVSREMLEDVQLLLLANGIVSHIATQDRSKQGWLTRYRLLVTGAQFKERFSKLVSISINKDKQRKGIRSHHSNYPMEVWKPLDIPSRYRLSLFDSTKERVSHYALTRVRERVVAAGGAALVERLDALLGVLPDAIISIRPLGPSEVYDFEVEDVHLLSGGGLYTSNSRRGALMLMLDDNHPDIEEFITVKRTRGMIEHANLSVCISDRFMEAVKNNEDWDLVWNGEVKKTIKARFLWDLICKSAWESAEPGMVFMDRCNKLSNTWYYEDIRCVNPCVTGDTLVSTERGYTPARDLQIGMKVRTPAGLKPIEKMYNNGLQRIYRVEFSDGGYLEGTADHKLKVVRDKKYQWVPIAKLVGGDKVLVLTNETFGPRQSLPTEAMQYITKRELNVANFYDRKLGLIVGTVLGDGILREVSNGNSHSYECKVVFGTHEDSWYDMFTNLIVGMNIHTHRTLVEKEFVGDGGVAIKHASVRLDCGKLASLLVRIGMIPNVKAPQKTIPAAFMGMEKEFLAGLLDGLFSTDGSVLIKQDNPMLRFHTSSYELAQQVRLILLQFGIHGRVYRATRDEDLVYNGRSMYGTGEKYDLIVMNEGIARFYAEIGLSHPEKAARLKDIAENWHYIGGTWTAAVVSVTDTEREEEVYDLYEPDTLTWITNGYCSLDCGEQPLPPWGVCNLGALNLSAFVHNGQMDWDRLAETSKVAMRFLDNVIDANEYFIEENRQAQLGTRRTGLGTMGLADALIKMKIAYGSEASVPVIERIYTTIRDAAYEASADIATEKGTFPRFEREKYMQGEFIKRLPRQIQDKIKKQGIRNAVLLTQAPTGTISLLAGASSGIEPVYDFAMVRRDRTGEHILYHPLLQAWRDEHPDEPTPNYFVASNDLTPEEHVRVQATAQHYIDSSISKTANAPNNHTIEQVQKLYRLAYDMGCKGITYYRDGSRDAVLTRVGDEKKATEAQQAPAMESVVSIQHGVKERPCVVQGYTRQVSAPEGKVNVTINSDEQGPLEVFVNVGKAGSDIAALAEALGRLISLNLRILSPLSQADRAQEIAEQLRGIGGSRSVGFGMDQVRSLPDAVARALEMHIEMLEEKKETKAVQGTNGKKSSNDNGNGDGSQGEGAELLNLNRLSVTGNMCPKCGCNTLVYEEGCKKCYSCGHSEC